MNSRVTWTKLDISVNRNIDNNHTLVLKKYAFITAQLFLSEMHN